MSDITSSFNEIKIDGDNNQIIIGSNEKFEPMIKWIEKKVRLDIKGVGKRYLPLYNKQYIDININIEISEIFNYIDKQLCSLKFTNKIQNYTEKEILEVMFNALTSLDLEYKKFKDEISFYEEEALGSGHDFSMPEDLKYGYGRAHQNLLKVKDRKFLLEKIYNIYTKKIILLSGEALIGKTHLFCQITLERIKNNKPTLLFFGNTFDGSKTIIMNMINQLGLKPMGEEKFLERLNKWGEEYNTRTLIMIDAINETKDSKIWQEMIIRFCEQIKSYPNLALSMSIRDIEKNKVITPENENYISKEIIKIEHKGFEDIELEAVQTFCEALEVEFPKVPIHIPRLFINPGMLFLYIESIKNSTKRIDTSIISPLTIFKGYISNLERKFYQKYIDEVDEDDEVVSEAINEFIALGSKEDYLHFYLDYKNVKKKLKPIHNKVLEFLISEGVLNKLKQEDKTKVYFTYQKFENFFIADYLINDYINQKEKIEKIISDQNGAIIEALFVQLPESTGKEPFELFTNVMKGRYINELYINSLLLRNPDKITDKTIKIFNGIPKRRPSLKNKYFETILQLSSIPKHPLNILYIHYKLLNMNLSQRDYEWSLIIHNLFVNEKIVKRIINWAWNKKEEFEIEEESLYLYGLTLSWFLTSSNRELRDSATKSLVNLFTDKINIFLQVLKEFENINDLYVSERLYAIGYGIVLRSFNHNGFQELAEYIYNTIFNKDKVIEHILLRDYARFTIEYIDKIIKLKLDLKKIHPPYNQNNPWELPNIEKSEIEKYRDDYLSIYGSSLSGDFKIYQVYSYANNFLNLKICDRPHEKMPEERYDDFFDSLSNEQKSTYDKTRLTSNDTLKILQGMDKDEILNGKKDESSFTSTLTIERLKEYKEFIKNYNHRDRNKFNIDIKSIKRLIFLEAINLGWEKELFNEFDRNTNSGNRHEHKTERIGKKYQWIALHTILAKLLDNYEYQDGRSSHKIANYEGTYQISIRDIDPTTILNNKVKKENKYWFSINKDFENSQLPDIEWMNSNDKLPNILDIINIKNNSIEYFLLNMNFSLDGNKDSDKYRNLYYALDSFIVKKDEMNSIIEWMKKQNFYAKKMPHSSHFHDTYLREYPNSNSYNYIDDYYYGQMTWDDSFGDVSSIIPAKVLLTSTGYFNEGKSYDLSVEEGIEVKLPNKWFIDKMDLRQSLNDGEWINKNNEVVFFDPTVESCCVSEYNENGVLVANKKLLLDFLDKNGYSIFWILWGEKQVRNTESSFGKNDDFLGISEISGYGYFDGSNFIESKDVKFEH